MNKDELLKIYSTFLLYDLEVQHDINGKFGKVVGIDANKHELSVCFDSGIWQGVDVRVLKPVFYDIYYLTKEIEHKGKKIIPIVELLKIKYPNQQGRYAETEFLTEGYPFACFSVDAGKTIMVNTSNLENQPFWIIKKLLEWHFNVFQLPEDQYINKATLKI